MSDTVTLIDTYLDAYSEPDARRRADLVASVFASEATLADPPFTATGHAELVGTFGAVLEQFPGHRFRRTSGVDEHHGVARYGWTFEAPDGTPAFGGLDVVTVGPDGTIVSVVGFIGDLPPA